MQVKDNTPMTFEGLKSLCEANLNEKYISECLALLLNGECIFYPGIEMGHSHLTSLYQFRLKMATNRAIASEEYLEDFACSVKRLTESTSEFIGISTVYGDRKGFFIFYEPDNMVILGVLIPDNPSDLKAIEENINNNFFKGCSSDAEKYCQGVFVRNWK